MSAEKVSENEMVELIKRSGFNKSISFKFGQSGVALNENNPKEVTDSLEEIRDEKELDEWHRDFKL